jgi:hypothetical protein
MLQMLGYVEKFKLNSIYYKSYVKQLALLIRHKITPLPVPTSDNTTKSLKEHTEISSTLYWPMPKIKLT